MNKIHSKVWNKSLGQLVVASELAAGGGSGASTGQARATLGTTAFKLVVSALLLSGYAIWTDAAVAATFNCTGNGTGNGMVCGNGNTATTSSDIAIGNGAVANGSLGSGNGSAAAIGIGAKAYGSQSTALGANAQAGSNSNPSLTNQSTAIGSYVGALGDQATAVGNNAQAQGNSSVAIGSDDLDKVAGAKYTATINGSSFTGTGSQIFTKLTGSTAIAVNTYHSPASGDASVALGPQAQAGYINAGSSPGTAGSQTGEFDIAIGAQAYSAGFSSIALGTGAQASADTSFAIGPNAQATGVESTAFGVSAKASRNYAMAIGNGGTSAATYTQATGTGAIALGGNGTAGAIAAATDAVAIGGQTNVASAAASGVAIGRGAVVSGTYGIAEGDGATANNSNDFAFGKDSIAGVKGSTTLSSDMAVGTSAQATGGNATAFGTSADAAGSSSMAVGPSASAWNTNDAAFGNGAVAGVSGSTSLTDDTAFGSSANATGGNSTAIGPRANAAGGSSMAIGSNTFAYNTNDAAFGNAAVAGVSGSTTLTNDTAFGADARATGGNSTAIAPSAKATGGSSTAIGPNANAAGTNTMAIGPDANAYNDYDAAIGSGAVAGVSGSNSLTYDTAVGYNAQATGGYSLALGPNASASGAGALAFGGNANGAAMAAAADGIAIGGQSNVASDATSGIAVGHGATVAGAAVYGIAQGDGATANQAYDIALGHNAATSAQSQGNNIAVGNGVTTGATGQNVAMGSGTTAANAGSGSGGAVAIGRDQKATGDGAVALGDPNTANGTGAVALGANNVAAGDSAGNSAADGAVAIGNSNQAIGQGAVALGNSSEASKAGSLALGDTAQASTQNAIALGSNSVANSQDGDVALGSDSKTAAVVGTSSATINGKSYDFAGTSPKSTVSVGDAGAERTITNVAAGRLSDSSTDAVNGSQLYATNQAIDSLGTNVTNLGNTTASVIGGGASYDSATGNLTGPTYNIGNGSQSTISDAINALNQGWNLNTGGNTSGSGSTAVQPGSTVTFNGGKNIALTQSSSARGGLTDSEITIATSDTPTFTSVAITNGPTLSSSGIDMGSTKISNLADGTDPNDAVNVSQLTNLANGGTKYFHANSTRADSNPVGTDSVAVGPEAVAQNDGDTAFGLSASTANGQAGDVALGSGSKTAAVVGTSSTTINGKNYDFAGTTPKSTVSVGDAGAERTITNVAAGRLSDSSTDAVNGSQLYATNNAVDTLGTQVNTNTTNLQNLGDTTANVLGGNAKYDPATGTLTDSNIGGTGQDTVDAAISSVNATANKGWNVTTSATGSGVANGTSVANVKPGDTATITADNNIIATQNGTSVAIGVNPVLTGLTSVALANGPSLSSSGIDMGNTKISNLANGTDANDAVNVSQLDTATNNLTSAGLNFTDASGKNGETAHVNLGGTLPIIGATTQAATGLDTSGTATAGSYSAQNLQTYADATTGKVQVQMADNPNFASVTAGNTVMNNSGVTVNGGANGPVSLTNTGLDNGDNTITHVAAGNVAAGSTDAVNGSQLYDVQQVANKGWNVTTSATGSGVANGTSVTNVKPGDTATITADNNIITTQNGTSVAIGVNPVLTGLTSVALANGPSLSSTGIDMGNTKISNLANGTDANDAVNLSQLQAAQAAATTHYYSVNDGGTQSGNYNNDGATGTNALAAGTGAAASGDGSTAVGAASTANQTDAVALGNGATAGAQAGDVALGSASKTTAVVGTSSTTINGKNYDFAGTTPKSTVSVGDAGAERTITNVAAGRLSDSSTDAVNGSQLYATNNAVDTLGTQVNTNTTNLQNLGDTTASVLGGNAKYDPATGTLTDSNIGGTGQDTVDDAISSVNATANKGWNVTTSATGTGVANGTSLANVKPGGTATITADNNIIATQSGTSVAIGVNPVLTGLTSVALANGPSLSSAGIDMGNTKISNLADGTAPNDAVNLSQLDAATGGVTSAGLNFTDASGKSEETAHVDLGGTLPIIGATTQAATGLDTSGTVTAGSYSAKNLQTYADATTGKVQMQMADNPNFTSVTTGNTVMNNSGVTVNGGANGPVSLTNTGLDNGGNTIAHVAAGNVAAGSTDAVNGSQLYDVQQVANKGWNVTTSATGSGVANGTSVTNVKPGDTATITADNNIITTQNGASVAIGVNPVLAGLTSVALANGPSLSSSGIDMGNTKINNLANGTDPNDAVNVSQLNAATGGVTSAGLNFTDASGKSEETAHVDLGGTLPIIGATTQSATGLDTSGTATAGSYSAQNLQTYADATTGKVQVQMADNPNFTSVTTGNTVMNNSGVTVNGGAKGPVSLTNTGLDNGGNTITNVAPGALDANSTEAVNGSQLNATNQNVATNATNLQNLGNSTANVLGGNAKYDPATGTLTDSNIGGTGQDTVDAAISSVNATANKGWNVTTSATGSGVANGTSVTNVKPGDTATITADNNIITTQNGTSVAIGVNPVLTGLTSVSLANGPSLSSSGIDMGNTKISHLANGTDPNDAVNVSQLDAVAATADNAVQYDNAGKTSVTLGGPTSTDGGATGGTTITNVHQGAVNATSTDAVNGSQLYDVQQIANNANQGWNVTTSATGSGVANGTSVANVKPGATATITAGNNLIATQNGTEVAIGVNPVLTGLTSVTAGDSTLDTNGLTVNNGTNSTTYGANGLSITNGPSVTVAGIAAGNQKITQVAAGDVSATSTDAVNGSQLYATNQSITNITNGKAGPFQSDNSVTTTAPVASGTNATAGGFGASATGAASTVVGNNATDNGVANSTVLGQGASIAAGTTGSNVALGQGSTVASAAVPTGSGTINGTTYQYAGGTPAGVVSVGSAGNERQVTNVAAGQVTATSTDAVNGSQLYATNQAITAVGTTVTHLGNSTAAGLGGNSSYNASTGEVTTSLSVGGNTYTTVNDALNAVSTTASAGWNMTTAATGTGVANGSSVAKVAPGATATITAGNNIVTTQNGADVAIGVNPVLTGLTSVTTGNTTVNTQGVTVNDGTNSTTYGSTGMTIANGPSVTTAGVNAGGQQITNVAAGTAANDAVNVSQLQAAQAGNVKYDTNADGSINYDSITLNPNGSPAAIHNVAPGTAPTDAANVGQVEQGMQAVQNWSKSYTDHAVNNVGRQAFAGVAAAMASGGVPQAYQPNGSMAGVAASSYHGQSAVAVGVSTISESGRWVFKASATDDSQGNAGVVVGAGIAW